MLTKRQYSEIEWRLSLAKAQLEDIISVFVSTGEDHHFWVREIVDLKAACQNATEEAKKITEGTDI